MDIDQQGELAGIHPTQKPVELFVRPIEYHTRRGTSSTSLSLGTQLIAAEPTRRCSPQVGSVFRREGDASVRLPLLQVTGLKVATAAAQAPIEELVMVSLTVPVATPVR